MGGMVRREGLWWGSGWDVVGNETKQIVSPKISGIHIEIKNALCQIFIIGKYSVPKELLHVAHF
jgi:hypothetical protein